MHRLCQARDPLTVRETGHRYDPVPARWPPARHGTLNDVSAKATPARPDGGRVRADTITRLEQAMSALGAASMTSMDERLP